MEKTNRYRIAASLGDLIAAAGEVAFEYSDNDKEGYKLARAALIEMLKKTAQRIDSTNEELENLESPSQLIH